MAHEITQRDGLFVVRNPSWHGLEDKVFPEHPTREQAQEIAHPWEPEVEPLYRKVVAKVPCLADPQCTDPTHIAEVETYVESETTRAVVRSDDRYELGGISTTREVVSNSTLYDIAEAIEGADPGSVLYETGGSLDGGRKVWLLLRLQEPIVIPGDPNGSVIPFFALQNHHVNGGFRGQGVADRIVCANTARMADYFAAAKGTEFAFSHTKNVKDRIEEAKAALAGWRKEIKAFEATATQLVSLPVTARQSTLFVERLIPMPPEGTTVTNRVRTNVEEARAKWTGYLGSATCEGIDKTAWGLVQASVEYLNWGRRAHSAQTLFARSMLDKQEMVTRAVSLAREVAAL